MDSMLTKMEEEKERKKNMAYLLDKRKFNIAYLKRMHEGRNIHWMNVALISRPEFSDDIQKRTTMWFYLGLSIAPLAVIESGPSYVRSLLQLTEEFEYHFVLHPAVAGVKLLLLNSKQTATHTTVNEGEALKAKINKVGNSVLYEYLKVYNNPIAAEMDYFQVVFALCEVLRQVYVKLEHQSSYTKFVYEAITKIDSRLKAHFFGFLSNELAKIATKIVQELMKEKH
eukprot:TRINITY_DN3491_c0_g1_i2.p1 TRINITY_DN3491_c0_g1~~TRINITY_DN3491_c0_g1_i2.p1  ORF type:complete len:227 (-),score=36.26 TRINITY_DN3491_c0_g1_i2:264-944(-)